TIHAHPVYAASATRHNRLGGNKRGRVSRVPARFAATVERNRMYAASPVYNRTRNGPHMTAVTGSRALSRENHKPRTQPTCRRPWLFTARCTKNAKRDGKTPEKLTFTTTTPTANRQRKRTLQHSVQNVTAERQNYHQQHQQQQQQQVH
uniref:Uncharacterized protein n=1 Tax=Anopheles minimus TaxID=112268 RepID=A0A182VWH8_9DIPT